MTDEERHLIAGKLVYALSENKRLLACLKSKADQKAEAISNHLLHWRTLGSFNVGAISLDVFQFQPSPPKEPWPTAEEISSLLSEIKATEERIKEQERQRDDLGLR